MATTTARRSHTVLSSTLAVGAVLLAACSGGDDTAATVVAEPSDEPSAAALTPAPTDDETQPTEPASTGPTPTDAADDDGTIESSSTPAGDDGTEPDGADDDVTSGDGTAPPPGGTAPAPPTSTASPATTTAPVTDPSTDPATDPAADPGDVDWTAVAADLLARHFRIAREPSLELVRAVCLEPSGCFDDAARTVDVLQRDGLRLVGGAPFEVVSVEFQSTADGVGVDDSLAVNLIIRFVATEQGTVRLVDDGGNVVSDVAPDDRFTPGQATARAVILGRDGVGAGWKLVALSDWM